jgi:3-methyladenine DNA glycosylase AlkD
VSEVEGIRAELEALADPERARHAQRYFKTGPGEYAQGDVFLGIRVPLIRKLVRQHKNAELDVALQLLQGGKHEERLCALLLMVQMFERGDQAIQSEVYQAYLANTEHIDNWDLVDSSAHKILGAYVFARDRNVLYQLVASSDLWERRIAIVATAYCIARSDFQDTLELADLLLDDKQDLIHKAVGWMLREVGKKDFEVEHQFLRSRYKSMPRTMLRYAIERFPEDLRQAYLKGTV